VVLVYKSISPQNKLGRPSLIYDLIEPFRYIADRVVFHLHDKNLLKKKDYTTTFRGHTRIKPPLTTLIIDKMNRAFNKPTVYQGREMMARTAIQKQTWEIKKCNSEYRL